jgi:hypothetical protein
VSSWRKSSISAREPKQIALDEIEFGASFALQLFERAPAETAVNVNTGDAALRPRLWSPSAA